MTAAYPPPPPTTSSIDNARTPLLIVGVLAILGAVALVASPLLAWHSIEIGAFGSIGRNGFGDLTYDGPFADEADAEDANFTLSEDEGSTEDMNWLLGSIADGVPVVVAGGIIGGIGLVLVIRNARLTGADRRRERQVLAIALIVVAAFGFIWTAASYVTFKSDIDDELGQEVEDDPFSASFMGGIGPEPGIGTLLAGLSTVGVGVIALAGLVVAGSRRKPIPAHAPPAYATGGYASPAAPPAAAWDPTRPPPPPPAWTGGGPAGPSTVPPGHAPPGYAPPQPPPPPAGGGPTPWSDPPSPS